MWWVKEGEEGGRRKEEKREGIVLDTGIDIHGGGSLRSKGYPSRRGKGWDPATGLGLALLLLLSPFLFF